MDGGVEPAPSNSTPARSATSQTTEETTIKRQYIIATLVILFGFTGIGHSATVNSPNRLEPCINGQVSALGLYPTQAEEDAALAEAKQDGTTVKGQVSGSSR